MYDKTIKIPAAGETTTYPEVSGEAVQFVRLGWVGASDRSGNPRLKTPSGSVNVAAKVGDPIYGDFDGLEIHNAGNSRAAGAQAILRVYRDRSLVANVPLGSQAVERSEPHISTIEINESKTFSADSPPSNVQLIDDSHNTALQLVGVTCLIKDNGLYSDESARGWVNLEPDSYPFSVEGFRCWQGFRSFLELANGEILPSGTPLETDIRVYTSKDIGTLTAEWYGLAYRDKNAAVPPI